MPDIIIEPEGTEQNFTVQDGRSFSIVFQNPLPFANGACAVFRFQYIADDPRIPQDKLYQTGTAYYGRTPVTYKINYKVYQGANITSDIKSTSNDGILTVNSALGYITLNYPASLTAPLDANPMPAIPTESLRTNRNPIPDKVWSHIDLRSMCFETAKYELFLIQGGQVYRPLYGTLTRNLAYIPTAPTVQC